MTSGVELDLLEVSFSLVFHTELSPSGYVDPFARDLDAERLAGLESVGEATQLGHDLGGGVDPFDVSRLLGHRMSS